MNYFLQLEMTGDWTDYRWSFDFFKLADSNHDLIFIKRNKIVIKDVNATFNYPHPVQAEGKHFKVVGKDANQKLILNPMYLGISCSKRNIRTEWKISCFDTYMDQDEYTIASCWATYYQKPMVIDYKYKNSDMGCLARYVGSHLLQCTIRYNKIAESFDLEMNSHTILNGRANKETLHRLSFDNFDAVKMWIEENTKTNFAKHTLYNVLSDNPEPFGNSVGRN